MKCDMPLPSQDGKGLGLVKAALLKIVKLTGCDEGQLQ